MIEQGDIFT